jgi:hypothetical protein
LGGVSAKTASALVLADLAFGVGINKEILNQQIEGKNPLEKENFF